MTDRRLVGGERIAVVQFGFTGHRLLYARKLLDASEDSDRLLLITSPQAVDSREMAVHLTPHPHSERLGVVTVPGTLALAAKTLRALLRFRPTRVVFLDGDRNVLSAALLARLVGRRTRGVAVLIMRSPDPSSGSVAFRLRGYAKSALIRLAAALGGRGLELYFLTDSFMCIRRRRGFASLKPVPDPPQILPLLERTAARVLVGVPSNVFLLGILGAQNRSKHADLVLAAAAVRADWLRVVVAGPFDEWTTECIRIGQAAGAVVVSRREYLSDAELGAYLCACDALALTYQLDAPSGFLTSAAYAKVPVLAAGSPWLTRVVLDQHLGVVSELTVDSIGAALDRLRRVVNDPSADSSRHDVEAASNGFARELLGTTSANP